ncbi:type VI secretion system accessory protein TagJ [Pseudoduganella violaceinigra]|uniref:type VI secretion system accessory protein TagJ n=1 Tax=Pseudoduganella violaceinigra TaxID=246602 RepID=UPI00042A578D|nr:type VI secretion system accessory protein TagJ [Pseudoduganella violaceinigra]
MSDSLDAEQSMRDGDPAVALQLLQESVRRNPGDAKMRIFLSQLLLVLGQWERALTQLGVAAELDAAALPMAQMYGAAIRCEAQRARVFAGSAAPLVFGQPDAWLALLIESSLHAGRGEMEQAEKLRDMAFERAPASSGTVDDQPFNWIADADPRLGPVLEAIINGKYYWLPFSNLSEVVIEAPQDLRDVVWMPAHFAFSNGGEAVGLVPTRYPGSELSSDSALLLSGKTDWHEVAPGMYQGLGQRMLATDTGELPLMDIRRIAIDAQASSAGTQGMG